MSRYSHLINHFFFSLVLLFPTLACGMKLPGYFTEPIKVEYVMIYYISPETEFVSGVGKNEILNSSEHNLFVRNFKYINKITKALNQSQIQKKKMEKIGSISFKIILKEKDSFEWEEVWIDRFGNIENFDGEIGALTKENFKLLIEVCEDLKESIDLKFQEEYLLKIHNYK